MLGANRETSLAVVQTLVTHGFRITFHHLLHLPAVRLLRLLSGPATSRGPNWPGCLNAGADWYRGDPDDEEFLVAQYRAMLSRCRHPSATRDAIIRVGDLSGENVEP